MICLGLSAQVPERMETLVRSVADHIISQTNYQLKDQNGKLYSTTKDAAPGLQLQTSSKYNKWMYVNGVMAIGMVAAADVLHESKYRAYADHNYRFVFDNLDYFKQQYEQGLQKVEWRPVLKIRSLDDCGAMAAGLLDVYRDDPRPEFLAYLKSVGDYILNKQVRLPDGTLARNTPRVMTMWADDLYMSVPFLVRMGKLTGDKKYIDFAIQQVESFNKYLFDPSTGLYFHAYYSDNQTNGVARWGRCNGWVALAQVALIDALPNDHPKRKELIGLLQRQITGFSRYQAPSGMWHQLLDKPDSYEESSVTSMFIYTVAKAVNEGWIPAKYISIAENGWLALAKNVTPGGQVKNICIGTSIYDDIRYYYTRPAALNDTHGLGPFLLAGTEMIKAEKYLTDLSKRR
jgi:rhamnogalacturonyl hydrolase YesR